jgi:hypothetical protein
MDICERAVVPQHGARPPEASPALAASGSIAQMIEDIAKSVCG